MIQWKSKYIGFTEQIVSGLNPSNNINGIIGSNHILALNKIQANSLSLSKQKVMAKETETLSSWMAVDVKKTENSLVSTTLQAKGSNVNGFDCEPPKILVVDDHAVSRMTAAALLGMEGYEVIEADSGYTAIEMVAQKQLDLILLDVMMPGMDGFQVCQLLKEDEHTRLIPVILITALNDKRSRIQGIEAGADDFLIKPFDRLELAARVKSLVRQKRLNEDLDHAEKVLFSIARAIESRDPNTGDHCDRLVTLGEAFAQFLNLSPNQIRNLMWGSYLHDIGKVGIPDTVLLKHGKLTPEEWDIMKKHVLMGEKICQPLRSMRGVIPIIRHHHERWDGSGYPDGLKEDEIPYLAQVFQVIDIYDALTSERPYKIALSQKEALSVMAEETAKGWRNPKLMLKFTEFILSRKQ